MPERVDVDAEVDLIERVRTFNRLYTRVIGMLERTYLRTPFSVSEARVVYELAHRSVANIRTLRTELGLDPGYMSHLIASLVRGRIVRKQPSPRDGREVLLSLTHQGVKAFGQLDARARASVKELLSPLSYDKRLKLVDAMDQISSSFSGPGTAPRPSILRTPKPGDLGWVVAAHGRLYALEYGWNEHFEALVADIVSKFVERFDSERERCWIAEQEGVNVGSVFCVRRSDQVAQLRLLLVEPNARGSGLGTRLVDECVRFARGKGYSRVVLWTNDVLVAARRIYEKAGFRLVRGSRHSSFGKSLVGQYWEFKL